MKQKSVFTSSDGKHMIMERYEAMLENWPVPCEYLNLSTRYGNTFVIASGNKDSKPVVLLHGSSTNSLMWIGDMQRLSSVYRVYAVDIIGEPGKSDEARPEMLPQNYAGWMTDILEQLQIQSASFVGNSLGGWFSLAFATQNPDRVNKLVLIATSGIADPKLSFMFKVIPLSLLGEAGIKHINKIVYGNAKIPQQVVDFGNLVYHNFNPRMGKLYRYSDSEIKKLSMPVFLIAGERDALLPSQKSAARLRSLLKAAKIWLIPERGHVIVDCIDEIMKFLAD